MTFRSSKAWWPGLTLREGETRERRGELKEGGREEEAGDGEGGWWRRKKQRRGDRRGEKTRCEERGNSCKTMRRKTEMRREGEVWRQENGEGDSWRRADTFLSFCNCWATDVWDWMVLHKAAERCMVVLKVNLYTVDTVVDCLVHDTCWHSNNIHVFWLFAWS